VRAHEASLILLAAVIETISPGSGYKKPTGRIARTDGTRLMAVSDKKRVASVAPCQAVNVGEAN